MDRISPKSGNFTPGAQGTRGTSEMSDGAPDAFTDRFVPSQGNPDIAPGSTLIRNAAGFHPVTAGESSGLSDAEALYSHFLKGESGATVEHLAYLDRGIDLSPYKNQISSYPSRLYLTPQAVHDDAPLYPALGEMPKIDEKALEFLHPEITNACVCIGTWENGKMHARWLGRNATEPVQMWSSTKIIPMANAVVKANQGSPSTVMEHCVVQSSGRPSGRPVIEDPGENSYIVIHPESDALEKEKPGGAQGRAQDPITVPAAFDAIVSYRKGGSMSNTLARMFKQFDTPEGLEGWMRRATGNTRSEFRGGYGEAPYFSRPAMLDTSTNKTVLKASGADHKGNNFVSAYDLSRLMTLLSWHPHLGAREQLPLIRQNGVDTLVRALGTDSARFADVAIDALGMKDRVRDPVIISKLGFGLSDIRKQYEEVYASYIQFTDGQTGRPCQVSITLRGAKPPSTPRAAMELDARMATQVALILQRLLDGSLH
ncbi:MAG: hypothetical protein RDV48_18725 [Candidatus Eremiobacteraeota bacterium]|nr:hypothetical protein [Candidatus Eremiobacteraeota bacterium]